jgi:hypothetical protein
MTEPIRGERTLPSAYPQHPHASVEARTVAMDGMILRVQVGSGVHGIALSGVGDDRDEMGICLEPPQYVTGVKRCGSAGAGFEQFERHTAWDREGGVQERSGEGDLDVCIYSARKWAHLALRGNPTVLIPLFVPDADTMVRAESACELIDNSHRFVSKQAASQFLGYLQAQRRAMTGERGAHTNRPELVALHGYDTKYAAHALRLGIQGVELLTTGRMALPMLPEHREYLLAVRRGAVALTDVLAEIERHESRLTALRGSASVPDDPDETWVNGWLHRSYQRQWDRPGAAATSSQRS